MSKPISGSDAPSTANPAQCQRFRNFSVIIPNSKHSYSDMLKRASAMGLHEYFVRAHVFVPLLMGCRRVHCDRQSLFQSLRL